MLVALCLFPVDAVVHGDGDNRRDLGHERGNVVGVGHRGLAAERQNADAPVRGRQWQPARHLSPLAAEERDTRGQRAFLGDNHHGPLLRFPDRRRGTVLGDRRRLERRHEIGRLEHDEPHVVGSFVVQQEREVVERHDRVQMIRQHPEQLGHGLVAGERLRDAE